MYTCCSPLNSSGDLEMTLLLTRPIAGTVLISISSCPFVLLNPGTTKDLCLLDWKCTHFIHPARGPKLLMRIDSKSKIRDVYPRKNGSLYSSHFNYGCVFLYIYILSMFFSFCDGLYSFSPPRVPFCKTVRWNWHSIDNHEIWHAKSVKNFSCLGYLTLLKNLNLLTANCAMILTSRYWVLGIHGHIEVPFPGHLLDHTPGFPSRDTDLSSPIKK